MLPLELRECVVSGLHSEYKNLAMGSNIDLEQRSKSWRNSLPQRRVGETGKEREIGGETGQKRKRLGCLLFKGSALSTTCYSSERTWLVKPPTRTLKQEPNTCAHAQQPPIPVRGSIKTMSPGCPCLCLATSSHPAPWTASLFLFFLPSPAMSQRPWLAKPSLCLTVQVRGSLPAEQGGTCPLPPPYALKHIEVGER